MRIRVTTRADLFEERKQQHIERDYRIEDERPIPVNGLCSFIALSEKPESDGVGVAKALNGQQHLGDSGGPGSLPVIPVMYEVQVVDFAGALSSIAGRK